MWLRVKVSKDELPWPVADIDKQIGDTSISLNNLRLRFKEKSQAEQDEINTWTDEELAEAFDEAIERQTRKDWPIVLPKIEMDDEGLVTLKFSSEVFFPSYIMRTVNTADKEQEE